MLGLPCWRRVKDEFDDLEDDLDDVREHLGDEVQDAFENVRERAEQSKREVVAGLLGHSQEHAMAFDIEEEHPFCEHTPYRNALRVAFLYITLYEGEHNPDRKVIRLPNDSVYTAALVMPQIARSAGWCLAFAGRSLKMALIAIFTGILQAYMATALFKAVHKLPSMDGRPHLCSYGTEYTHPPPKGPFGVTYDPSYGNIEADHQTAVRTNVLWLALRRLGMSDLAESIGPVEFGMESPTCRFACVFIYIVAVTCDANSIVSAWRFLLRSPTTQPGSAKGDPDDLWIEMNDDEPEAKRFWKSLGKSELDNAVFKMNGMPWTWKRLWAYPLLIFRCLILVVVGYLGFYLLMETGGIVELILNALALNFILEMDELMFKAFCQNMTRDLMERLEPYVVDPDEDLVEKASSMDNQHGYSIWRLFLYTLKCSKLLIGVSIAFFVVFVVHFELHCRVNTRPFTGTFLLPWSSHYYKHYDFQIGGFAWWMGHWESKEVLNDDGEVTCRPYSEISHASPEGCGLPDGWFEELLTAEQTTTGPLVPEAPGLPTGV